MQHRPVDDALRQIGRVAAAGEVLDLVACDASVIVEADPPIGAEIVPLAGKDEIVVTVEPHLAGPAGHARRKRRERRPLRRLAFLAAEGAAHAADLAADIGIRHAEHARDDMLDLGRMLRRGIDVHRPVLARDGERDLALKIEMLLAADPERALEPVRCGRDRRRRVAMAEGVVRQHRFAARRARPRS